jgi:hypothetical protein
MVALKRNFYFTLNLPIDLLTANIRRKENMEVKIEGYSLERLAKQRF